MSNYIFITPSLLLAIMCTAQERARADAYANLPHGPGFRNVRDFGAKGDGITEEPNGWNAGPNSRDRSFARQKVWMKR